MHSIGGFSKAYCLGNRGAGPLQRQRPGLPILLHLSHGLVFRSFERKPAKESGFSIRSLPVTNYVETLEGNVQCTVSEMTACLLPGPDPPAVVAQLRPCARCRARGMHRAWLRLTAHEANATVSLDQQLVHLCACESWTPASAAIIEARGQRDMPAFWRRMSSARAPSRISSSCSRSCSKDGRASGCRTQHDVITAASGPGVPGGMLGRSPFCTTPTAACTPPCHLQ